MNLDTYRGHIDSMEHIEMTREPAFHLMMADIYAKARYVLDFLSESYDAE